MLISIIILAIFSLIIGYFMYDLMIGIGSFFWGNNFYVYNIEYLEIELIKWNIKLIPLFISFLGYILIIGYLNLLQHNYKNGKYFSFFSYFFFFAGFFNYIYNEIFLFIFKFSYLINVKWLDKGYLEFFGPYGIYKVVKKFILNFSFTLSIFINYLYLFIFILILLFISIISFQIIYIILGVIICFIEINNIKKKL
jgi:hypothetical protein